MDRIMGDLAKVVFSTAPSLFTAANVVDIC